MTTVAGDRHLPSIVSNAARAAAARPAVAARAARVPRPINWGKPILEEHFASGALNRSLFDVEVNCLGGGNEENQCYVDRPENLRVERGRLVIEARRGDYTGSLKGCTDNDQGSCTWTQPFTSARIRTRASKYGSWRYGRIEVRAQLPAGAFLWPAIWLMPTDEKYGGWPASGEIDIMEARGQAGLRDTIEATLHYGGEYPNDASVGSDPVKFPGVDLTNGMHDYTLEWTGDPATGRPKLMRWLLDGRPFYQRRLDVSWKNGAAAPYTKAGQPWDQRFHLILNLAVGGNFFSQEDYGRFDSAADRDAAAAGWTRPRFEVEHIKVWALPPK